MNTQTCIRRLLGFSALIGATFALNAPASAGPKLFSYLNGTMTINGSTETNQNNNVDPFNIEVFSLGGECLRIAVTAQGTDLEATLLSPGGVTWRDDDGNGALRPLIKAITTQRGWYILRLSHYAGASVNADFTAQISRYPSSNTLCAGATPPREVSSLAAQKPAASAGAFQTPVGGAQQR